jgi:hypothetical protein
MDAEYRKVVPVEFEQDASKIDSLRWRCRINLLEMAAPVETGRGGGQMCR